MSVDGRVDVVALRNTSFKNQRCGVYKMRVLEAAAEGVGKAMAPDCAMTYAYGATYSHQVIVPDNFYPGAVMEPPQGTAMHASMTGSTEGRDSN